MSVWVSLGAGIHTVVQGSDAWGGECCGCKEETAAALHPLPQPAPKWLPRPHPQYSQVHGPRPPLAPLTPRQDRDRSHLTLWTYPDDPPLRNANTTAFLDHWVAAGDISIRAFDYNEQVKGTPLEGDAVFGEYGRLRKAMVTMATYTDVVRLLLLHNYGGAAVWGFRRNKACLIQGSGA